MKDSPIQPVNVEVKEGWMQVVGKNSLVYKFVAVHIKENPGYHP